MHYGGYQLFLVYYVDIYLTVWISVLEFVDRVHLFLTNCTSGVCFRDVFTDAVRPQWHTIPNVYFTRRSPNIFACWQNLDSLTTRRQYHSNNVKYIIHDIYTFRKCTVLNRSYKCVIWGFYFAVGGPGSSVRIATDYGLDGPGSNPGWDEIFRPSRPALRPTQPPVKWVPGLSRGLKCGRGVLLTTHPLLLPRSRKSRAIPLPTL